MRGGSDGGRGVRGGSDGVREGSDGVRGGSDAITLPSLMQKDGTPCCYVKVSVKPGPQSSSFFIMVYT